MARTFGGSAAGAAKPAKPMVSGNNAIDVAERSNIVLSEKDVAQITRKSSDDKIVSTVAKRESKANPNASMGVAGQSVAGDKDINIGELSNDSFGPLLPYILDVNVTDVNWNGRQLWIDDLKHGRYCARETLTDTFVQGFATRVSNVVSESFNKYNPRLEAETEELRISILHSSIAHTGTSISIRKTPAVKRINFGTQIKNGDYCSEEMANFMSNSVKSGLTTIVCGLPGDGKTELIKYLTSYIPPKDRVITIEDNLEIHYHNINPDKDCVELKVDESFTYVDAIKASLRQLPKWIMVAEARGDEIRYLMEAISTGAHCMTTIHTDEVNKLPSRIQNMVSDSSMRERIKADTFTFIDLGILIRKRFDEKGNIFRYLAQMGVFDEETQSVILIFDEGKRTQNPVPRSIMRKFRLAGIEDPFVYHKLPW